MSFFDEDDEPARRQAGARPARPRPGGRADRPASADNQTLLIRRLVALGGALVFLILAVVAINGCLDARKENALKDYNRELASIVRESDQQVAQPFFDLMNEGGRSAQDLQSAISGYRVTAEQQLDNARDLDVPGEMANAQESALIALELRANALGGIAQRIRPALGDQGEQADQAIAGIAGQMQNFLASDVLWEGRVVPLVKTALDRAEIGGQTIASTQRSLQDLSWLTEATVADRLGQSISTGNGGGNQTGEVAPGLHGNGLTSVTAGGVTLTEGAANRIPAGTDEFTVTFANQGENDEFDVQVVLRIEPATGRAIVARQKVDEIARGAEAEVVLKLNARPPTNEAVTVRVEVRKVPGEEKVDNNSAEYQALFEG